MKANPWKKEKSQARYYILRYLAKNPYSSDTLEGIVQWWLLEQRIEYQTAKVKEALDELVAKGLILENKGRDARIHYRINGRKHAEIQELLKQKSIDMGLPHGGASILGSD